MAERPLGNAPLPAHPKSLNQNSPGRAERLSVFDIIKIGIGPSSSHTTGPWLAAHRFLREIPAEQWVHVSRVVVRLFGSLSKTGKGHATDVALQMGLSGTKPQSIDADSIAPRIREIAERESILLDGRHRIDFHPGADIVFSTDPPLPFHPNGMLFCAELTTGETVERTYYSVGGGFVISEDDDFNRPQPELPYPIDTAAELLAYCQANNSRICDIVRCNERVWRSDAMVRQKLGQIIDAMLDCVFRGCNTQGTLPGGLGVQRRAAACAEALHQAAPATSAAEWLADIQSKLVAEHGFDNVLDWVTCFALAVNEENAALGRIVTAPTNGAAGVIPAVLLYYRLFCEANDQALHNFLLTAGEIGCLFKKGATISAAMGGCQAEIGVSSAMAAAALAEGLGGTPAQAATAAEIAMEHHLGMTCDPINGLVQVPCIERNAFGAIKAIAAARLALKRDPRETRVSLDGVIQTMWRTAQDMHQNYKETSEGGLAVLIPVSVCEC